MAGRAFQRRSPRGRCPSCHKLGLGNIKHSMVGSRGVAYRACQYCGEQVDMVDRPATPASDSGPRPARPSPVASSEPPRVPPGERKDKRGGPSDVAPMPTAAIRSSLVDYTAAWATCDGTDMSGVDAAMARVSEALEALDRRVGTNTREERAHD